MPQRDLLTALVNRARTEIDEPRDSFMTQSLRPELDDVNDASFDSFPASDPPAWSSMHAGAPQSSTY